MNARSRSTCSNEPRLHGLAANAQVADAVIAARGAGASWQKIGSLLGTSAQAAQQRYGSLVDAT
jgi:hypothetical protein